MRRPFATCLLSFAGISRSLAGQTPEPIGVPDAPSCERCTITVREVIALGDADGDGALTGPAHDVRVDQRGRYWVFVVDELPFIFDKDGDFWLQFGRKGQGPGEYMYPADPVSVGDSVLVLDAGNRRATVLDADLQVVRSIAMQVPGTRPVVIDWPSLVVLNMSVEMTSRAPGQPLQRTSFAGRTLESLGSFGPVPEATGFAGFAELDMVLSPARERQFWSADRLRYRMTRWTAGGNAGRSLIRAPEWFQGKSPASLGNPSMPPPPKVAAIREDFEGLLWVFIHLPGREWQGAWPAPVPGTREYSVRSIAMEKLYRTAVEVIDPRAGRVVARHFIEGNVIAALPERRAAIYTVDQSDIPRVSIVALGLSGR